MSDIGEQIEWFERITGLRILKPEEVAMTEHKSLHEAMLAIQKELKDPTKDSINPHFRSKYADLKSVCDCIRPVAHKHGVYYTQGGGIEDGAFIVVTRIIHAHSGQEMISQLPLGSPDQKIQELCGRITYLRRYALVAVFGLAPEDDDDDGEAASGRGNASRSKKESQPARQQILAAIKGRMAELKLTNDDVRDLMVEANLGDTLKGASDDTLRKVEALLDREADMRHGSTV